MKLVGIDHGKERSQTRDLEPEAGSEIAPETERATLEDDVEEEAAAVAGAAAKATAMDVVDINLYLARELAKMEERQKKWEEEEWEFCVVCEENPKDIIFQCGHVMSLATTARI